MTALRARIRALEEAPVAGGQPEAAPSLPLGAPALDGHLPGGGLPLHCLHEIEGERAEWDDGAAAGFCLALLARLSAQAVGPVLWVSRWRDLYAPGVAAFGLDPGRLLLAHPGSEAEVLWALEEGLRCPRLLAVVGELELLERSAGQRLQLAAKAAGVSAFLLRRRSHPGRRAEAPSAATTRWRVAPAASASVVCTRGEPLDGPLAARLPGRARWQVELLRCRGAAPGRWLVEWNDATGDFALAAVLRDGALAEPAPLRRGAG